MRMPLATVCLLIAGCASDLTEVEPAADPAAESSGDTVVAASAARDPATRFAESDTDRDGKLSGDEIPAWIANNLDSFDTDGDGAITQEEMESRMGQFRAPAASQGGGFGGGGGGGDGGFDPTMMFTNWDADGDGKLSGDEIRDRMRQNLDEIDTDGDGAVSLEEWQERIRRRRAEGGFGGGGARGGGENADPRPERPQRPE